MKARLKAMEDEANALKEEQKADGGADAAPDASEANANREEADSRSVHVGGVDYATTPEELQKHFAACGTVNRVTILTDKYDNPKGFAYVEFLEADAVPNACRAFRHGDPRAEDRVNAKRTNVPGMKAGRGGQGGAGEACSTRTA